MVKVPDLTNKQLVSQIEKYNKILEALFKERDKRLRSEDSADLYTAKELLSKKNETENTDNLLSFDDEEIDAMKKEATKQAVVSEDKEEEVRVTKLLQLSKADLAELQKAEKEKIISYSKYVSSYQEDRVMGQEIEQSTFTELDRQVFAKKLKEETSLLKKLFDEKQFSEKGDFCGIELEGWILDKEGNPSPENQKLLSSLNNPQIVPEISKFNFEINSKPQKLEDKFLYLLEKDLEETWLKCEKKADQIDRDITAIGILPTVKGEDLVMKNMSALTRYAALNAACLKIRSQRPFEIDIKGVESLKFLKDDVMMEAAATSLQIHLQSSQEEAADLYNLSLILSAPMVAMCANAPSLYGKKLWHETRIPIFEQSVQLPTFLAKDGSMIERVFFGDGYINCLMDLFHENLKFPVLLPYVCHTDPSEFSHLRLHNGNIWRWNRPIIGIDHSGSFHLRVEHRVNSAGPSIIDIVANTALYIGMSKALLPKAKELAREISFDEAKKNFYKAAKYGLEANLNWKGKDTPVKEILLKELIPEAKKSLSRLGADSSSLKRYFDNVLTPRALCGINGAAWQLNFLKENNNDYQKLIKAYLKEQKTLKPVHLW